MSKNGFYYFVIGLALMGSVLACTIRGAETPTPFSYPTPDLTMTALFAPTQLAPATSVPIIIPTAEVTPLATAVVLATPLPTFTPTTEPTQIPPTATPYPTSLPAATLIPTVSYQGPGVRPGVSLTASRLGVAPTIDGDLTDWSEPQYPVQNAAYGDWEISSATDLSGTVMVAWDNNYLYIGARVTDENYVQNATGRYLFKGDSIEILLDINVSDDFYYQKLSGDDYQVGVSPGNPTVGNNPEAYLWFPWGVEGPRSQVQIGVLATVGGYQVEAAFPWSMFGVAPYAGEHFGFGFSISDNDNTGTTIQQSMVSNLSSRLLANPMTWGDLLLGN